MRNKLEEIERQLKKLEPIFNFMLTMDAQGKVDVISFLTTLVAADTISI